MSTPNGPAYLTNELLRPELLLEKSSFPRTVPSSRRVLAGANIVYGLLRIFAFVIQSFRRGRSYIMGSQKQIMTNRMPTY